MFDSINTANGNVVDRNGEYANVLFFERGWTSTVKFGNFSPCGDKTKIPVFV